MDKLGYVKIKGKWYYELGAEVDLEKVKYYIGRNELKLHYKTYKALPFTSFSPNLYQISK